MRQSLQYLESNFPKIPVDLRDAIMSVDFLDALNEIQKKYLLHIDQAALLEELTFKVMLGDIDETDYVGKISSELSIDKDKSLSIATDVQNTIFQPIIASFKEIQDSDDEEEVTSTEPSEDSGPVKAADILSEIENPTPSIGVEHEITFIEKTSPFQVSKPQTVTTPLNNSAPNATTSIAPIEGGAITPPLPVGWPTPAQGTVPTAINTESASTAPAQAAPAQTPTAQVAAALSQKLEEPTASRPTEIQHSIDPYKEPIE